MARLQILELPEGESDERPPFVLVVDECPPHRVVLGMGSASIDPWQEVAERIGARGVIVTPETVEIPANEVPLGPDGYPIRLRVEADLDGFHEQIADAQEKAQRELSDSETLGHTLLQRAENAEGRAKAMEVQRDRATHRAEQAEAGRLTADNMLRAVCEVFGGPHRDPVVEARETLARAERAERSERDLVELIGESRRRDVERMDQVTDALGLDRLRDWDEIVAAAEQLRPRGEGGQSCPTDETAKGLG